jgi:hypothetical protein
LVTGSAVPSLAVADMPQRQRLAALPASVPTGTSAMITANVNSRLNRSGRYVNSRATSRLSREARGRCASWHLACSLNDSLKELREARMAMSGRALLRLVPAADRPASKVVHDSLGRAIWAEELPPDIADGLSLESPTENEPPPGDPYNRWPLHGRGRK